VQLGAPAVTPEAQKVITLNTTTNFTATLPVPASAVVGNKEKEEELGKGMCASLTNAMEKRKSDNQKGAVRNCIIYGTKKAPGASHRRRLAQEGGDGVAVEMGFVTTINITGDAGSGTSSSSGSSGGDSRVDQLGSAFENSLNSILNELGNSTELLDPSFTSKFNITRPLRITGVTTSRSVTVTDGPAAVLPTAKEEKKGLPTWLLAVIAGVAGAGVMAVVAVVSITVYKRKRDAREGGPEEGPHPLGVVAAVTPTETKWAVKRSQPSLTQGHTGHPSPGSPTPPGSGTHSPRTGNQRYKPASPQPYRPGTGMRGLRVPSETALSSAEIEYEEMQARPRGGGTGGRRK
jgi:hypothetical protein